MYAIRSYYAMYKAEMRAREKGVTASSQEQKIEHELKEFESPENVKARAYNALIPVGIIVFGTIAGLIYTGWDSSIWHNQSVITSYSIHYTKLYEADPVAISPVFVKTTVGR